MTQSKPAPVVSRTSTQAAEPEAAQLPRLLIEQWLPAAAIGVECIRERSTGQQPPDKRLHVWWARRPLVASRAAVLAPLLPADFPRDVFERLLGFGGGSKEIIAAQQILDLKREDRWCSNQQPVLFGGRMRQPSAHTTSVVEKESLNLGEYRLGRFSHFRVRTGGPVPTTTFWGLDGTFGRLEGRFICDRSAGPGWLAPSFWRAHNGKRTEFRPGTSELHP